MLREGQKCLQYLIILYFNDAGNFVRVSEFHAIILDSVKLCPIFFSTGSGHRWNLVLCVLAQVTLVLAQITGVLAQVKLRRNDHTVKWRFHGYNGHCD